MASAPALCPTSFDRFGGLEALCRVFVALPLASGKTLARLAAVAVKFGVRSTRKSDEVSGGVIRRVAVDVVNVLVRAEAPSTRLFPHKTVLGHVARLIRQMVVGHPYKPVAPTVQLPPALPPMGAFSSRVVPVNEAQGEPLELPERRARLLCDHGASAATALTYAARSVAGWGQGQLRSGFKKLGRSLIVPCDESSRPVPVVRRLRNPLAATTFANVLHANNLVGEVSQVNR